MNGQLSKWDLFCNRYKVFVVQVSSKDPCNRVLTVNNLVLCAVKYVKRIDFILCSYQKETKKKRKNPETKTKPNK